jgi:YD repeat-containing protein
LKSSTDALGHTTAYYYDNNRRIDVRDANGGNTFTYHDRVGNVTGIDDDNNIITLLAILIMRLIASCPTPINSVKPGLGVMTMLAI